VKRQNHFVATDKLVVATNNFSKRHHHANKKIFYNQLNNFNLKARPNFVLPTLLVSESDSNDEEINKYWKYYQWCCTCCCFRIKNTTATVLCTTTSKMGKFAAHMEEESISKILLNGEGVFLLAEGTYWPSF
jgi:hypothetical protein